MVALASLLSERQPSSQLAEQVRTRLHESGRQSLRELRVEETQGLVVVSGQVPSFYLKQLAQTIAAAVEGVDRVCNQTVVARDRVLMRA